MEEKKEARVIVVADREKWRWLQDGQKHYVYFWLEQVSLPFKGGEMFRVYFIDEGGEEDYFVGGGEKELIEFVGELLLPEGKGKLVLLLRDEIQLPL